MAIVYQPPAQQLYVLSSCLSLLKSQDLHTQIQKIQKVVTDANERLLSFLLPGFESWFHFVFLFSFRWASRGVQYPSPTPGWGMGVRRRNRGGDGEPEGNWWAQAILITESATSPELLGSGQRPFLVFCSESRVSWGPTLPHIYLFGVAGSRCNWVCEVVSWGLTWLFSDFL